MGERQGDRRVRRVAAPLRQEVVDLLRDAIVSSEFAPGERLVESRLCARFDVSRTVIRESLRQLETEGFVTMVAHRGPVVAVLGEDDARSLYEARAALEALAGKLFAERATEEDCAELERAMTGVRKALEGEDLAACLRAKDAYYDVLLSGTGNAVIHTMLRTVHARTQQLRGFSLGAEGRADRTLSEMEKITDAAARLRRPDLAEQACAEHVRAAAEIALETLRQRQAGTA